MLTSSDTILNLAVTVIIFSTAADFEISLDI